MLLPLPGDAGKHTYPAPPALTINTAHKYLATIITNKGTITLCLDPTLAPNTVNNFVFLARNYFYNGLKWHRVVAGFVIQGGDPLGTGSGGPGYKFNDEPVLGQYTVGAVAMANSGANTNGSQFFICTVDDTKALAKSYNLFGYVASGMDVVLKIAVGDVMTSVAVQEQS
jgi:cyclophilin family peptidyl-prolyl cis-trans isomerase